MQNDVIISCEYTVLYDDINNNLEMTNIALLRYLEEPGAVQTKKIFGSMLTPKGGWILLNWRIKKFKNLKWNEKFSIKTWPAKHKGIYSIRNFEIYNENNELVIIAETKWVLVDCNTKKIVRNIEDIVLQYGEYEKMLFDTEMEKLKEPDNLEYNFNYIPQRRDIDTNGHVNNQKYLEIAYEALPEEVYKNSDFKNIEIMYKNSAFLGKEMKIGYKKEIMLNGNESYILVFKSNNNLNAIIRLS